MTIFKQLRLVCLLLLGLAWTTTLSFASVDVQSPTICGVSIGYDQAYASHNGYDAAPLRAWEDENQSALADTRASFGLEPGFIAAKAAGALDNAAFAQKTFSQTFSSGGRFAGQTIDDVAAGLRSGAMKPADVPIEFIVRDGNSLILNTRSAQALQQAGIPRSAWNAIDMTGDAAAQARLSGQLQRNGLTSQGILNPTGR